jgi:hypothetical protein
MRTLDLRDFSSNMRDHFGNSTATHEVALSGFLALKGKFLTGQYPYWIRNGGTVPVPHGFEVTISSAEIQRLSSKLMAMLNLKNNVSMDELATIQNLTDAIEKGWGQSSKWAKDSKKYFNGVRVRDKTIKQKLQTTTSIYIKAKMPLIYRAYKTYKKFQKKNSLSFLEYANVYSNYSYEVIRDMLLLEIIWKTFPNGIPLEVWPDQHL